MSNKNMLSLRERLEELSTAELDAMMQAELRKKLPDENAVKLILGILEGREKDISMEMDAQTEAAWEKYQERIAQRNGRRKHSNGLVRIAATMAAVFVFAMFVFVPQRAEALEFIREMLSRWKGSGILEMFNPEETVSELERVFETDHPGMQLIYDTAVDMGVEDPLIPMWFEEELEVTEHKIITTPSKDRLAFSLTVGSREVVFNVDIFSTEIGHGYCGEYEIYKSFEREGVTYEITRNYEKWVVIWKKDNVEYSFVLDCQEEILDRILSSIYVMEE